MMLMKNPCPPYLPLSVKEEGSFHLSSSLSAMVIYASSMLSMQKMAPDLCEANVLLVETIAILNVIFVTSTFVILI